MDIHEFRAELKDKSVEITPAMWQTITTVYNHHPGISGIDHKAAIALLFELGGMTIINDMFPRAAELERIENEIRSLRNRLQELTDRQAELMR